MKVPTVLLLMVGLAACMSDVVPTAIPTAPPTVTVAPSAVPTNLPVPTALPTATPLPTLTSLPTVAPAATTAISLQPKARVLFAREQHLWLVDVGGQNVRRITPDDLPDEGFGKNPLPLSPDGQYAAIAGVARGTWLIRLEGKDERQLSRNYVYPSWSPDSQSLTYSDEGSIYVRSLSDWQRPRRIASGNYGPCSFPTWSPDGQWIAFVSYQPLPGGAPGSLSELLLSAPDGSRTQILHEFNGGAHGCWKYDVQWSSDGRFLLVQMSGLWRIRPPDNRYYDIRTVNTVLAPTMPVMVSDEGIFSLSAEAIERKEISERCPWGPEAWAFDGTRLACVSGGEPQPTILLLDLQSGTAKRIGVEIPSVALVKWIPQTDWAVLSEAAYAKPDNAKIWLLDLKHSSAPRLVTQGILIAVLTPR